MVPIEAFTNMLLSGHFGDLNENQKERLEVVKTNVSSLRELVSNTIDSKKIELGQISMNKKKNDITKIVANVIATMDEEARKNGTWFFYSPGKTISAMCDSDRISQVLTNVIKNSMNAVKKDAGEIRISLIDDKDHIKVKIDDNGKGIPEEKLLKIFSKSYKTDMSETQKGGVGLGLYLCKQIIDSHGGNIWIESDLGKGTTVHFTLPKN